MGWISDFKESAEAKFREKAEAYARDMVLHTIKSHLTLENLPKLKRVLLLSADQELAEVSWKKFEAVIRKYSDPNFTLIGRANVTPDIERSILRFVCEAGGVSVYKPEDYPEIVYGLPSGESKFMTPINVWQNSNITGCLQKFIDNPTVFAKIFESLTLPDVEEDNPLFYLANLAPIMVLYFLLAMMSYKDNVEKIDTLLDLLVVGVVPYCIALKPLPDGEVCLCGDRKQLFVVVDR